MKLNVTTRESLINVIMRDALQGRSDKVRTEMVNLMADMRECTFGKTPQARTANRRKMAEFNTLVKHLRGKKINVSSGSTGHNETYLSLNLAGESHHLRFKTFYGQCHTVDFYSEFCSTTKSMKSREYACSQSFAMGNSELALESGNPLIKRFENLRNEASEIKEASEELILTITPMLKATTLGKAIEKWPELEAYAPLIMSQSKEIIVRPEVLSARIKLLKSGKGSAKSAMNADA
tara:strand:- start:715 stop:1422 length:708 start_codon:yes stop_codon:yes gene_type:complete